MFRPRLCNDPDSSFSFQRDEVCDQFAEMVMITLFELIFYDDRIAGVVLCPQIYAEVTCGVFTLCA